MRTTHTRQYIDRAMLRFSFVIFCKCEAGLASKTDLDAKEQRKSLVPAGNRAPAVHPVARRYTDWAIYIFSESQQNKSRSTYRGT
jgi:hypothetical protein